VGGSIWGFGDPTPRDADGWQAIPIEPAVVQARIDGVSHGFCVMDDVGNEYARDGAAFKFLPFPNRFFSSRDDSRRKAPYFTLWLEDGAPPPASRAAEAEPADFRPGRLPPEVTPRAVPAGTAGRDLYGEPLESLEFFAARGEAVGFSIDAGLEGVSIDLPVRRFAMPEVAGLVDPLVPSPDGRFVEVLVPKDARPGRRGGTLRVAGREVPFGVTVWNFTLPDRLSFVPQMNAYGLPERERDYYRLAHEHRTTLNTLPYGWTGKVRAAPTIGADGTWDWREWDARFGPLLDGSAFSDLPRGAVPVDAFYLPLNENWPMDHERHFRGGYWIESAYDEAYWREFREAAGRFADHVTERRWTEPMFEFYLNNKVYFKEQRGNRWDGCSAAWIFDEPVNTQDFWALRRFGLEFWRGVAGRSAVHLVYRGDISRPQWQRDLLDGVVTSEVVSGILRTYRERIVGRSRRLGTFVSMYGAANAVGTSSVMPAAWCVETWAIGADGVVPWQTIGTADSWQKPDPLALFYPTPDGPVPSLRLKSFRAGQELVEYLTMYCAESGESRAGVGAAVLAAPGLTAATRKTSEDDAGTAAFGKEAHQAVVRLRHRLGVWLDPRPRPPDPRAVRDVVPLPPPERTVAVPSP
jgi:hypothetical protein